MWGTWFPVLLFEHAITGINANFTLHFQSYFIFAIHYNPDKSIVKANQFPWCFPILNLQKYMRWENISVSRNNTYVCSARWVVAIVATNPLNREWHKMTQRKRLIQVREQQFIKGETSLWLFVLLFWITMHLEKMPICHNCVRTRESLNIVKNQLTTLLEAPGSAEEMCR